jgi:DNA-binding MarR family transcriptional regulator
MTAPSQSDKPRSPDLAEYHERIPYLIGAISNLLAAGASRLYRKAFGIGLAEARLMWVMSHEPALTVQRAACIMGVDKGATSRTLAGLVRRGLVQVTVDARDGRRRIMVFSDAGGKLRDQIMAVSVERERRVNAIFPEAELKAIRLLLNKLLTNVREVSEFDPPSARQTGHQRARVKQRGDDGENVTVGKG